MNKAAKIGMLIWTILCFMGACSGMMNVANKTNGHMSDAEATGAGIGMFIWILLWFFPMVGMGIIALVTRPKTTSNIPLPTTTTTQTANLCPHCGKYFGGQATFCPYCGKPQALDQVAMVK